MEDPVRQSPHFTELLAAADAWMEEHDLPDAMAANRYGIDPEQYLWMDIYPRPKPTTTEDPGRMLRDWSAMERSRIAFLYVHIPFCIKRCSFCYYNISTDRSREGEYVDALLREASSFLDRLEPLASVGDLFIGGGTPSTVAPAQLQRIFDLVYDRVSPEDIGTVTLELHPRTMRKDLHTLVTSGHVRRVSMGVQSFSRSVVEANGRIWVEPERIWSVCDTFRTAGVERIGLDFMVGLHTQAAEELAADVEQLDKLIAAGMIDSVSVYPRSFNVVSTPVPEEVVDANHLLRSFRAHTLYRRFFETIGWKEGPMYLFTPKTFTQVEPSALVDDASTVQALGFGNSARSNFGRTNYLNIRDHLQYLSVAPERGATGSCHPLTRRECNRRYLQFGAKAGTFEIDAFPLALTDDERSDLADANSDLEQLGLIATADDAVELTELGMLLVEHVHRRYEDVWMGPQHSDDELVPILG